MSAYNIEGLGSKREIRDKVEELLEGSRFVYKVNVFLLIDNAANSLHLGSGFENRDISFAFITNYCQQGLVQEQRG